MMENQAQREIYTCTRQHENEDLESKSSPLQLKELEKESKPTESWHRKEIIQIRVETHKLQRTEKSIESMRPNVS